MKIISFISQKGGVGKSTLSYILAKEINQFAKCCIVDYDEQGSISDVSKIKELGFEVDVFHYSDIQNNTASLNGYEYLIMDTPPYMFADLEAIILVSDIIIIPTQAGLFDIKSIGYTYATIKRLNKQDNAFIVFNGINTSSTLFDDFKTMVQNEQMNVLSSHFPRLTSFTRSSYETLPKKAQEIAKSFYAEVMQKLNKRTTKQKS